MAKIKVENPVVEIDGDEMTRIIWQFIKDRLIHPYLDVDLDYYDLGIESRDATDDQVTIDAANAIKRHGVGVKCATITPDEARVEEFGLKKMWVSPNGTIRNILGGVVFREPIIMSNVPRLVPGWTKPIIIGRHAHGDQYKATNFRVAGAGELTITFTPDDGSEPIQHVVARYGDDGGVAMGMYNFNQSIEDFARASFAYGLQREYPVYLSTKNTILKAYDGAFKDIFAEVFEREFKAELRGQGTDVRAPPHRRHGGCSDEVGGRLRLGVQELRRRRAVGHRGAGLRLARPDDVGADDSGRQDGRGRGGARDVTRHFRQHQAGKPTSTNPIASIYAWTRGAGAPRQARRHPGGDRLCRDARGRGRAHGRGRQDDQGPRTPGRCRAAVPDHRGVPGRARPESQRAPEVTQSVELLLDAETDRSVRAHWQRLAEAGLPSQALHTGPSNRPHITLAADPRLAEHDESTLRDAVAALPISVRLGALACFGRSRFVLVRLVVASSALLELQQRVVTVVGADTVATSPLAGGVRT
jgi:isocitrate dehydrogenase